MHKRHDVVSDTGRRGPAGTPRAARTPRTPRPIRGGKRYATDADLPYFAAIVGRTPARSEWLAFLESQTPIGAAEEPAPGWWSLPGRVLRRLLLWGRPAEVCQNPAEGG